MTEVVAPVGFCDGEVGDGGVNDRRIVGAGDGDGETELAVPPEVRRRR